MVADQIDHLVLLVLMAIEQANYRTNLDHQLEVDRRVHPGGVVPLMAQATAESIVEVVDQIVRLRAELVDFRRDLLVMAGRTLAMSTVMAIPFHFRSLPCLVPLERVSQMGNLLYLRLQSRTALVLQATAELELLDQRCCCQTIMLSC